METAECLDELPFDLTLDNAKTMFIYEGKVKQNKLILENNVYGGKVRPRSKVSSSKFYDPLPYPQASMGSAWSERDYIVAYISLPFNVQRKCTPICTSLFYDVIFSCQREGADSFGTMSEFKFFNDRDSASESLITAEEVGLYLPLVLCIGTVLSVGFGPPVEANSVLLEVLFEQTVSAAALFFCLNLLQVFHPVASHEDDGSNPTSSASGSVEPDLPQFIDSSSQTEDRNFKVETLTMKQKYDREVRRLEKESRAIRRKYGKQIKDLRQKINSTDRELSSLQLQVPALDNERSALLSEMDAVDKQLEEEQSRFDTLMSKFKTFHAQLIESGIASLMTVNFSSVESRQDEDIPDVVLNDYSDLSSIQINAAES